MANNLYMWSLEDIRNDYIVLVVVVVIINIVVIFIVNIYLKEINETMISGYDTKY